VGWWRAVTVADAVDSCPLVANLDQDNLDQDSQGDACDGDEDGDTIPDASDNCPQARNGDQANLDSDAQGDVCDVPDSNRRPSAWEISGLPKVTLTYASFRGLNASTCFRASPVVAVKV
jgi:hypothetical protein